MKKNGAALVAGGSAVAIVVAAPCTSLCLRFPSTDPGRLAEVLHGGIRFPLSVVSAFVLFGILRYYSQ